jgi:predicted nucleic acid-binding protein
MSRELFVDTSGFFAILARRDAKHAAALRILKRAKADRRRLITTDYVLDETATLLKARGEASLAESLFERVQSSSSGTLQWTDPQRFAAVRAFFLKHLDQAWSFTDCLSFCVMKDLRIAEALTTDQHFEQAGFVALLK